MLEVHVWVVYDFGEFQCCGESPDWKGGNGGTHELGM